MLGKLNLLKHIALTNLLEFYMLFNLPNKVAFFLPVICFLLGGEWKVIDLTVL